MSLYPNNLVKANSSCPKQLLSSVPPRYFQCTCGSILMVSGIFTYTNSKLRNLYASNHLHDMTFCTATIILSQALIATSLLSPPCPNLIDTLSNHPNSTRSSVSRVLLVVYPFIKQADITETYKYYSKLRDLHHGHPQLGQNLWNSPLILYFNLVAVTFNSTLISSTGLPDNCIPPNWNVSRVLGVVITGKIPRFVQTNFSHISVADYPSLSFATCQIRQMQGSSSPLDLIRNTADHFVWLCLVISIIGTSLLVKVNFSIDFSLSILTTLSVVISPGISGSSLHSKLFLLWTFTSLLLVTYYGGSLTSVIMKPPPDKRASTFLDLEKYGYLPIFDNLVAHKLVKENINHRLYWSRKYKNFKNSHLQNKLKIFKSLVSSSTIIRHHYLNMNEEVANKRKLALFGNAGKTIRLCNFWNKYFKQKGYNEKRCYISQELYMDGMFHFYISSERGRLAGIVVALAESGLVDRLFLEHRHMLTFERVQDRSRFISMTKLVEEVDEVKPLRLSDGKFINVFILWAICWACCIAAFVTEFFCNFGILISSFWWIFGILSN